MKFAAKEGGAPFHGEGKRWGLGIPDEKCKLKVMRISIMGKNSCDEVRI